MGATSNRSIQRDAVRALLVWGVGVTFIGALLSLYLLDAPLFQLDIRFIGPTLMLCAALASAVVLHQGHVGRAVDVLAFGVGVATTAIAVLTGGVHSPVMPIYPVLILVYGWTHHQTAGPVMTLFCLVCILGLWMSAASDALPAEIKSPEGVFAINALVACVLAGVAVVFIRRVYQHQLSELDQLGNELASYANLLEQSEARYCTLIERMPEAILVHRNTRIVYANPAALQLFGAPDLETLMRKSTTELICPEYVASQTQRMQAIINGEDHPPRTQACFQKLDGTPVPVEVQGTAIEFDGEPAIHVSIRDITERQRLEQEIRQLAFYDALTGLPNRRLLDDRLEQALAASQRSGGHGALMFLDLDNFKPLNDRCGHAAGDQLLIQAAARLKSIVRAKDTVARYGGDEFIVLLPELGTDAIASEQAALQAAQKIQGVMAAPYALHQLTNSQGQSSGTHSCTVSIGLVVFAPGQADAKALVAQADAAMYQAKQAGCNQVVRSPRCSGDGNTAA